jgi:hypothetical protein
MTTISLQRVGPAAAVGVAALAAFGVWLAISPHGGGMPKPAKVVTAVSEQGLRTIAGTLGQPIYWAGSKSGMTYELTRTPDGRSFVRYLPKGVAVGAPASYLTIATYPIANAFTVTSGAASRSASVRVAVGHGAVAFYNKARPTNVYEAFPRTNYQVEVYSPSPTGARQLVSHGLISALGGRTHTTTAPAPRTAAVAATRGDLTTVARKLGRPIFWAGSEQHMTYELTQTPDGRVYVRYLPAGVKVGVTQPHLTVGTYPVKAAFATTSAAAAQKGAVKIHVAGGVAFYSKTRPTSVYLAFKGTDEQIEVFDPSVGTLHRLIASGHVRPVH